MDYDEDYLLFLSKTSDHVNPVQATALTQLFEGDLSSLEAIGSN